MGLPSNWRSPTAADEYANHDFADFAQEFLRRNPDYQADYKGISETTSSTDEPGQREAISNKWGLLFRLQSRPRSARHASPLASRSGASRTTPYLGAIKLVAPGIILRKASPGRARLSVA